MTDSTSEDDEHVGMEAEVARVRAAGILGRPGKLMRLFDFLVERTSAGASPKESEIALEVFGRSGDFIAGEDAVVRVYVHRLRKKLEAFYGGEAASSDWRLAIPRGEYRLQMEANGDAGPGVSPSSGWAFAEGLTRKAAAGLFAAGLLVAGLGGWGVATILDRHSESGRADFLEAGVWRGLAESERPLLVVLGDYYIHGELDDDGNVRRLVREFSVNSRDELYQRMLVNSATEPKVMDLGLSYLPTSSAAALAHMAPLIANRRDVRVVTASSVTPQMLSDGDVLYIGFVSGMGGMLEPVFRGARVELGDSFDELRVRGSDARYISGGTRPSASRQIILDYGYFSSFPGPNGNRITVLAGTRDVGLAGVAAAMVDNKVLRDLPAMRQEDALELLFEAEGAGGVVLAPNLVLTEHHDGTRRWTTGNRAAAVARPPNP